MEKQLILSFFANELVEATFVHPLLSREMISVRGKTAGAFGTCGSFQWTSAVQAFAVLCIRATRVDEGGCAQVLSGTVGSPAASLDYAISKEPVWLLDMLGQDSVGRSLASRLIRRTNPNMKRPGPVVLSVNQHFIDRNIIKILIDGKPARDSVALDSLETSILARWKSVPRLRAINAEGTVGIELDKAA